MLKMLIAVDGSDHARRAINVVADLARMTIGLEAVVLHVREGLAFFGELPPFDYESIEQVERQHQEKLLATALAQARSGGIDHVLTQAAAGDVATEIVRVADMREVDQIVLGTHGRSVLGSLFLGSVAQRVVHLSKVPVLLVK